jgi:hypothetical protein
MHRIASRIEKASTAANREDQRQQNATRRGTAGLLRPAARRRYGDLTVLCVPRIPSMALTSRFARPAPGH